jgi:hypothetical protein
MTIEPVGNGNGTGAASTPNSPVSPQSQTPIAPDSSQLFQQLESKLSERFEGLTKELRGLQSRQDKSENTFQTQLAKLEQYEKQGLTREQAFSAMTQADQETQWKSNLEKKLDELASKIGSVGTQSNGDNGAGKVFEALGLDLKDVRVASALVKKYDTPEQVRLAAYDLREEISKSPNPSNSQNASMNGANGAGGKRTSDVIAAELAELQQRPGEDNDARRQELLKELANPQG